MNKGYLPRARRSGLNIEDLPEEILVFDTENEQANCLNSTAALVWKNADGTRSVSDIAAQMTQTLDAPVDSRVVWYALEQLSKKNLLQERAPIPSEYAAMTRRAFLSKASIVGAAVAIPVIVSIIAPTPAQAGASGCGVPNGESCFDHIDCCSECCAGNICSVPSVCV